MSQQKTKVKRRKQDFRSKLIKGKCFKISLTAKLKRLKMDLISCKKKISNIRSFLMQSNGSFRKKSAAFFKEIDS